jgi:hypothetical protein
LSYRRKQQKYEDSEPDMGTLDRGERLQIMLNGNELKALDDWRFTSRMPSRASAIRELLKRGLAAVGFNPAEQGVKSSDYGVIEKPTTGAARPKLDGNKSKNSNGR